MLRMCILRVSVLFLLLVWVGTAFAGEKDKDPPKIRVGYNYGRYSNHLSGPEIYMWRINHQFNAFNQNPNFRILEVTDEFSTLNDFNGLSLGLEIGSGSNNSNPLRVEFGWNNRHKTSDVRLKYDLGENTPAIDYYEKVKIRYNAVNVGLGYRPKLGNFYFGAGMDLGLFLTKRKIDAVNVTDKGWNPWFYTFKVFGDGTTGKTPVVGYSIFASYD
ncbi:MAG: hypothetical protein EOP53_00070, partial [Sphingobacteriales bacterium]